MTHGNDMVPDGTAAGWYGHGGWYADAERLGMELMDMAVELRDDTGERIREGFEGYMRDTWDSMGIIEAMTADEDERYDLPDFFADWVRDRGTEPGFQEMTGMAYRPMEVRTESEWYWADPKGRLWVPEKVPGLVRGMAEDDEYIWSMLVDWANGRWRTPARMVLECRGLEDGPDGFVGGLFRMWTEWLMDNNPWALQRIGLVRVRQSTGGE